MMMTTDVCWTNTIMAYNKNRTWMVTHWQWGCKKGKGTIRGKMTSNNSSAVTTHTYTSRTGNSKMMAENTLNIVDRVCHVLQLLPITD